MPEIKMDSVELRQLAQHATHHGNCSLSSWNQALTKCKCGLFQLLRSLERRGLLTALNGEPETVSTTHKGKKDA